MWPGGRLEYFVTGIDNTVYHIWQDDNGQWSGWFPFHGTWAQSGVFLTGNDRSHPTTGVIGADK